MQFLLFEQLLLKYLLRLFKRRLFRQRIECNRLHGLFHLLQLRNQLSVPFESLSPLRKHDDRSNLNRKGTKVKNPRRIGRFI